VTLDMDFADIRAYPPAHAHGRAGRTTGRGRKLARTIADPSRPLRAVLAGRSGSRRRTWPGDPA
jgi:hypothetical protein